MTHCRAWSGRWTARAKGSAQGVAATGVGWGEAAQGVTKLMREQGTHPVLAALRKNRCPGASAVS